MISDVLSDAVTEIEEYEANSPESYSDPVFKEKLALVKGFMTALRAELDSVPGVTPYISPAVQAGIKRVRWESADGIGEWIIADKGSAG